MHRDSTPYRHMWGAILGAIFGAGIAIGFSGGWELLATASLPLVLSERLNYLQWTLNPLFLGVGLGIGAAWGLLCASLTGLGKRKSVLILILFLMSVFFMVRASTDGTSWGVGLLLALCIIGYGLLQLHLYLKRPLLTIPLVLLVGFLVGYIPWNLNGRDTERAAHRTQAYAQKHNITDYQISITQAESGGYRTQLHLEDGSILYCYAWPYEEFKECTPTPQ